VGGLYVKFCFIIFNKFNFVIFVVLSFSLRATLPIYYMSKFMDYGFSIRETLPLKFMMEFMMVDCLSFSWDDWFIEYF
jgi:hypothetical protein